MGYVFSLVSMLFGVFLMLLPGTRPWEDLYRKYNWAEIQGQFRSVKAVAEVGPKDLDLPRGRIFKVKVTIEASPREIFGPAARKPAFPKWLRLPATRLYWDETPWDYPTIKAARTDASKMVAAGHPHIFVNPANYHEAVYFTRDIPVWAKTGIAFVLLGLFTFVVSIGVSIRSMKNELSENNPDMEVS